MKDDAERKKSESVSQRKGTYIMGGVVIGFAVPMILVWVITSLFSLKGYGGFFEELLNGLVIGIFATPFLLMNPFVFAVVASGTLLGGLIGYRVWKAKLRLEKSPTGQRLKIETALWKAKEELEGHNKAARK